MTPRLPRWVRSRQASSSRRQSEPQLSAITEQVRAERLTYLSTDRLHQLELAIREIDRSHVSGAVVEFGLALGGSGIVLASLAPEREYHGFDVFSMIPEPTSEKDDDTSRERYAVIASGASEGIEGDRYYGYLPDLYDRVVHAFDEHGVSPRGGRVHLHRGLFEATLPTVAHDLDHVGLVHIDCDWYEPVRYCLDAIAPSVAPGGVVVIDDYFDYAGCRAATDEFLQNHTEFAVRHRSHNISLRRTK